MVIKGVTAAGSTGTLAETYQLPFAVPPLAAAAPLPTPAPAGYTHAPHSDGPQSAWVPTWFPRDLSCDHTNLTNPDPRAGVLSQAKNGILASIQHLLDQAAAVQSNVKVHIAPCPRGRRRLGAHMAVVGVHAACLLLSPVGGHQ